MFLVTSITMLRERTSGTLERLMSMPIAKLDLLSGYGIAFGVMATLQAVITASVAFLVLGLDVGGSPIAVVALAIANAVLGMSLGLCCERLCDRRGSAGRSCRRSSSLSCFSAACSSPGTRWPRCSRRSPTPCR